MTLFVLNLLIYYNAFITYLFDKIITTDSSKSDYTSCKTTIYCGAQYFVLHFVAYIQLNLYICTSDKI